MANPGACFSCRSALLRSASRGYLRGEGIAFHRTYRCTLHATEDKMIRLKSKGFLRLLIRTPVHRQSKLFESGQGRAISMFFYNWLPALLELRGESFHCCIFAGNFTSLSAVQSYLCGD